MNLGGKSNLIDMPSKRGAFHYFLEKGKNENADTEHSNLGTRKGDSAVEYIVLRVRMLSYLVSRNEISSH